MNAFFKFSKHALCIMYDPSDSNKKSHVLFKVKTWSIVDALGNLDKSLLSGVCLCIKSFMYWRSLWATSSLYSFIKKLLSLYISLRISLCMSNDMSNMSLALCYINTVFISIIILSKKCLCSMHWLVCMRIFFLRLLSEVKKSVILSL